MAALLRFEDVNFAYAPSPSGWALRLDTFEIEGGGVTAFVGPNGSGKSTLLRLGAGMLAPVRGRVLLGGVPLPELDRAAIARRLGYLPQETTPQFDLTVDEVVRMGRYVHLSGIGGLRSRDRDAIQAALAATECLHLAGRRLSSLSGGERRRVYLASVLAQEPRILLLDEPGAALDLHYRVLFFRRLRHLAVQKELAVAVVTHDLNLATLFADQVFLLHQGQFAARGTPEKVFRPAVLRRVYGPELLITRHPEERLPVVLPRGRNDAPASNAPAQASETGRRRSRNQQETRSETP